jgi:hypothetical protein
MKLRRVIAASVTAAALLATTVAAFPAAAAEPDLPQALPALTSQALSARYQDSSQAIAVAARSAASAGNAQLASALEILRTRQVLFFDPRGQGLTAVVIGDLATASRVAILVPGSDTTLSTFFSRGPASPGGGAIALAAQARRLHPATHLAVIAWLGYQAPATASMQVATSGDAEAGARALRPLVVALARHGQQVALLCHSYGSVVCGVAAAGLPVTDIAVFASPGMDAPSAASLGTKARVWAGRGGNDWVRFVPHVRVLGLGFGSDPMSAGFGARIFAAGAGGHSDYLRPGSVPLRNLAEIATGNPAAVTS